MTEEAAKPTYEPRDNSGAMFKNGFKMKDGQPDKSGTLTVNNEEFRLSGWENVSKKGTKFVSLKFAIKGVWTERGKGVLFANGYKSQDQNNDYSGTATIDDEEYIIKGWDKTSAKGLAYVSLAAQAKDDLHPLGTGKPEPIDDEIPY
jgi:uncharacterized protein (DUF736 family)